MLRKKIERTIKTTKGRKQKTNLGTKNKVNHQKAVTNMVATNPTAPICTLNINGLNMPSKRQRLLSQSRFF